MTMLESAQSSHEVHIEGDDGKDRHEGRRTTSGMTETRSGLAPVPSGSFRSCSSSLAPGCPARSYF